MLAPGACVLGSAAVTQSAPTQLGHPPSLPAAQLFVDVTRFHGDTLRFLADLDAGVYVAHSLEALLRDSEPRQLLVEALSQCALLPLLLDARLEGGVRERLVVAHLRASGSADAEVPDIEAVVRLTRSTGYDHAQPAARPRGYPEDYLARFKMPPDVVHLLLGRLRLDDVYNCTAHFPAPTHRSAALATQAAAAYVLLYFAPEILREDGVAMRELVDRHYADSWVVPWAPGHVADLTVVWAPYSAARAALDTAAPPAVARRLSERHAASLTRVRAAMGSYLAEGVLDEEYVLTHHDALFAAIRDANVTARWLLLHAFPVPGPPLTPQRASGSASGVGPGRAACPPGKLFTAASSRAPSVDDVTALLMDTAALEDRLKTVVSRVIDASGAGWAAACGEAVSRVREMGAFFGGDPSLSRAPKDEALQRWFGDLATSLEGLRPERPMTTGRKLQRMVEALKEVESFRQVDASLTAKAYLADTRLAMHRMLRMLAVGPTSLATLAAVADASWAWAPMHGAIPALQRALAEDPTQVHRLRCLFLKLRSLMDLALLRPSQGGAACGQAFAGVSRFYSRWVVTFAASVLDVVPAQMFAILTRSVALHTRRVLELPSRLEKAQLKDHAQLDERFALAEATHSVAVFTQGVLAMQRTFCGVLELDPRRLLEQGLCTQVCAHVAAALHEELVFTVLQPGLVTTAVRQVSLEEYHHRLGACAARMDALRESFEYIQDFVNVSGLRVWNRELGRVALDACAQELVHLRTGAAGSGSEADPLLDGAAAAAQDDDLGGGGASDEDTVAVEEPGASSASVPRFASPPASAAAGATWLGRLCGELVRHTAPVSTVYAPSHCAWFMPSPEGEDAGVEVLGIRAASTLHAAVGLTGMCALDRLLVARVATLMRELARLCDAKPMDDARRALITSSLEEMGPPLGMPELGPAHYADAAARVGRSLGGWHQVANPIIAQAGQLVLLRGWLAGEAERTADVDAGQLAAGVDTMWDAFACEEGGGDSDDHPAAKDSARGHASALLRGELVALVLSTGQHDPTVGVRYLGSGSGGTQHWLWATSPDGPASLMFWLTLSLLPRYVVDKRLALLRPGRRHVGTCHDATPVMVGIGLVLTQAGPAALTLYLQRMAQYCRLQAQTAAAQLAEDPSSAPGQPPELVCALAWLQHMVHLGIADQGQVDALLPPWLVCTIVAGAPAPRR